ncbi:guanylate kinase [Sporomusa acidovorans]|uniref:Guanylate kinase n=1 Tax=Sporomusa acidovorans (strain ATCC 49682 / DSM 3132 / Mol) TaxID=1123286 RepID=A0ABZ3J3T6_SPOA4|nr:guanylate kinase [Sporomusa acidovorans]OZC20232.1 guanylate kinase [Sporomusa acidovorans DSM 3132]SDD41178.1 guanylate kinase [Sporomusa acidovorans]
MAQGILIVVSGPSGTGKGTICRELLRNNPHLKYSISATTRQPREGEIDGVNYLFITKEKFKSMIVADDLLEWAEVYGNFYGTPRHYVLEQLNKGFDIVLEIDTQGAMKVKEKFPDGVYIYIIPPSLDELADRIFKRGTDSLDVIKKRLNCASSELSLAQNYHYIVVNDQVTAAVQKIETIIAAEKLKAERNTTLIDHLYQAGYIDKKAFNM